MKYLSFFSGALGLDLGLEKQGMEPLLFCEKDKICQQTIKMNKPNVPLIGDIQKYTHTDVLELITSQKVDLIVGGPPCQAFSTAGARKSFDDDRGNVFTHFLDIATELAPKYIVIENVRGLLSAVYKPSEHNEISIKSAKGSALEYVIKFLKLKGYSVSFNLYNSANFGTPQIRERLVIIAYKGKNKVPYLNPTHSNASEFNLPKWATLRDAIFDLPNDNNVPCAVFPEKRLKYYRLLKSGQNWKDLPIDLQKEALGKSFYLGGGKTGFLRRLSWNKPSPTLVTSPTMPATDLAHPEENRPLNIAEYKRIQEFPDSWLFAGKTADIYKQIGNAVPISLGSAIAKAILMHNQNKQEVPPRNFPFSRYKKTSDQDFLFLEDSLSLGTSSFISIP